MLRPVWQLTIQLWKVTAILSLNVCRDTIDCKSMCISYDQQRLTHVHGLSPKLDTKLKIPIGLKDCQCPATPTSIGTVWELVKESHNIGKENVNLHRSWDPEGIVFLYQAATILAKERNEEDEFVLETVSSIQEKESWDEQMGRHNAVETLNDNELDTGLQNNVSIGAKDAGIFLQSSDKLSELQEWGTDVWTAYTMQNPRRANYNGCTPH